ncbi:MAG TPA: amino acid ABC transporter permease [Stellaceae bacterium]|nr:amino acid ABC transporter permease [Stellaceae bacterium]
MDWHILWQYRAALWDGLVTTVWLSALAIVGSTAVGVLVGCLGATPSFYLRRLTAAYTELLRNLPLLVKVFFFYFVLSMPTIPAALLGLVLHQSAYIADVTGAGIRSVARGQLDAGLALGHGYWQVFRYVILPQAVRIVIPPMTTQYVAVIKNSSIVALIAVQDLTYQTQQINVETFRGFEAATAATVLYVIVALGIIGSMTLLQRRVGVR